MKIKNLIGIIALPTLLLGGMISLAKASFKHAERVNAADYGTFEFNDPNNDSNAKCMYAMLPTTNGLPAGWDTTPFAPVDENSGTFVNGTRTGTEIKKVDVRSYYIPIYSPAKNVEIGTIAVVKGSWTNGSDTFTVAEYSRKWDGAKWVPVLQAYDKITLSDVGFEDKDRVTFDNTVLAPSAWNTYAPSSENTTNSFAFEFEYESFSKVDGTLQIRVGTSGPYEEGHHYRLDLNNSWGPNGVMVFWEYNGTSSVYRCSDIECDLSPGSRHTIEFGSIYIQGKTNTFNYVKYDGAQVYGEERIPSSHTRSTKVSFYYGKTNIFFGSTATTPKTNTQILRANHFESGANGVFLDGTLNDIPHSWETKGAPVSNSNMLRNGDPLFTNRTGNPPMSKPGDGEQNSYFLSFQDVGVNLNNGDYITVGDEFRFFSEGTAYSMNVIPFTMKFVNGQMINVENLHEELLEKISNHCNLDYYEDDKVDDINAIIDDAEAQMLSSVPQKQLWVLYKNFIAQLDAIPISPEKYAELLAAAKADGKDELDAIASPDNYDEANLAIVTPIVNDAKSDIDAATTIEEVDQIVQDAKAEIAANAKTKQVAAEEAIMASDTLLDEYLEVYDVITTSDLSCVGDMVFHNKDSGTSYSSGGFDDTTTRFATSSQNTDGNVIFQFNYSSTDPNSREYEAQIFIRMRGAGSDSDCFRFEIGNSIGEDAGVGIGKLVSDHPADRLTYNSQLAKNTTYKIECGCIDLEGFARTLLFMKVNNNLVLKEIVDSYAEHQPTIRIMDSFTEGDDEARLSPIEEGTSKGTNNPTLLGRLMLDPTSTKTNLSVTLKANSLPVDATLFPAEENAFTVGGQEIAKWRSETNIRKVQNDKYSIEFNSNDLVEDGTIVHIGGLFSYLNGELSKSLYRFFATDFVYHESTNSWSQTTPTDRETILYEAKETLKNYVNKTEYSAENQTKIQSIIDEYLPKLDAAETEQIQSVLNEALGKIDVIPTILGEARAAGKNELATYSASKTYRSEEQAELNKILNDAYEQIDAAADQTTINSIVATAKAKINGLKTAEQRDAEDLLASKKSGKAEVNSLSALLEMDRYSEEDQEKLVNLTYDALANIEKATSEEEVAKIVAKYKESIKEVQTTDGSIFDGEKYVKEEKGLDKKTKIIIIACSVGGALLIGGGVTAGILISKKKRRQHNEKA